MTAAAGSAHVGAMEGSALPNGAIVVGVDGSALGDRAVRWAADEAAVVHAPLVLVHATGSLGTAGTVWLTDASPEVAKAREHGEELLVGAADEAAARHRSLVVHTRVVSGDPREVLVEMAQRARLVVVGSRGRGHVRSVLLGSVSAAVARRAVCPVAVVRPHHPGKVRRGVLVGVDATAASHCALEVAYHEAAVHRLPLTVVHCVGDEVGRTSTSHAVSPTDAKAEEARLLLAECVAGMSERFPDVRARLELRRDPPEHALKTIGTDMDLVVVGRSHRGALAPVGAGNVSGYLVEHARTVVVVVPEEST